MDDAHILVVDDDRRLRELLRKYLSDNGYLVATAADAAEARQCMAGLAFDMMVLDVMMPGEDGMALTRSLRAEGNGLPILLLTARGEVDDRIKGLESGADDYLSKPFEPRELLLRVASILRRSPRDEPEPTRELRLGAFVWDMGRAELRQDDQPVHLTQAERDLLSILAEVSGQGVSRDDLAARTGNSANPRTVDVQVTRLRKKIEDDPKMPRYLQTVRGMGYMLRPD
ncbi:response regulator [Paramagnetospirillum magneticum]|uniref:Response regulator consisting of a CheY-like receiver domain and a winged-helix DNA-binding domain n=1 Tax=Paramagnetospirillum magneticum (strain ATCC 700264 / AMB-1) TaxID=342108 RepID=Q2W9X2_PARM1|nr:response regulator [Paramagnetospirillum magneticum]BAE49353.1 Response regulator consisting of a CheY-like receiver domain and a winged-helix DNA-binding domain [Paramagnetospirillum magneticum AMB-1]